MYDASPQPPALASFGNRFLGQFIDGLIPVLVIAGIAVIFAITGVTETLALVAGLLAIGFWFFYLLFADGLGEGQSFGKRIVKTRVIDMKTGEPCTFWQSFLRNVFSILGIIDWIFLFFDEKRQRLGDKVAGTVVVEARAL